MASRRFLSVVFKWILAINDKRTTSFTNRMKGLEKFKRFFTNPLNISKEIKFQILLISVYPKKINSQMFSNTIKEVKGDNIWLLDMK